MTPYAYLTKYDGLLCTDCAENTDDLVNGGSNWLASLTPLADASDLWPGACCEECKRPLALSLTW